MLRVKAARNGQSITRFGRLRAGEASGCKIRGLGRQRPRHGACSGGLTRGLLARVLARTRAALLVGVNVWLQSRSVPSLRAGAWILFIVVYV